jgi:hypothetical protein
MESIMQGECTDKPGEPGDVVMTNHDAAEMQKRKIRPYEKTSGMDKEQRAMLERHHING